MERVWWIRRLDVCDLCTVSDRMDSIRFSSYESPLDEPNQRAPTVRKHFLSLDRHEMYETKKNEWIPAIPSPVMWGFHVLKSVKFDFDFGGPGLGRRMIGNEKFMVIRCARLWAHEQRLRMSSYMVFSGILANKQTSFGWDSKLV